MALGFAFRRSRGITRGSLCAIVLLSVALLGSPLAYSQDSDSQSWLGEWKAADPSVGATLSVKSADSSGVRLSFNEGAGINGLAFEALAVRTEDGARSKGACSLTLRLQRAANPVERKLDADLSGACEGSRGLPAHIAFIPVGSSFKTGFDCRRAGTAIEKLVCTTGELAAADLALAEKYSALRKAVDPSQSTALQSSQREWIKARDALCDVTTADPNCLRRLYGARRLALAAWPEAGVDAQWNPRLEGIQAIAAKGTLPFNQGLSDYLSGWFAIPEAYGVDDMEFHRVRKNDPGMHWIGCTQPKTCERMTYVGFLPGGQMWLGYAHKNKNQRTVYRPYGVASSGREPEGLAEFRRQVDEAHGSCSDECGWKTVEAPQFGPPARK